MSFCTSCGHTISDGESSCSSCGNALEQNSGNDFVAQEPILFREYKKKSQRDKQALAAERRADRVARIAEAKVQFNELRSEIEEKIKQQKRRIIFMIAVLATTGTLFGIQSLINFINRPENVIDYYIQVIKAADWDALKTDELFPETVGAVPEYVKQAFDKNAVANASFGKVNVVGSRATAEIYLTANQSEKFRLNLESKPTTFLFYSIPNWSISSHAPVTKTVVDGNLLNTQNVRFGSSTTIDVSSLRKQSLTSGEFSTLPGVYKSELSAIGFYKLTSTAHRIWKGEGLQPLLIAPSKEIHLTNYQLSQAGKKARGATAACAKSKCNQIPKYQVGDFDLWSQYDRSSYTYSKFTYKAAMQACSELNPTAINAHTVEVRFSCEVNVSANLYVQYVYYRGWYSNYYYYWNFKDNASTTVYPSVRIRTDDSGTKILGISAGF